MNEKKITKQMISLMAKQSLKASRMRNVFVMTTIILASALLTVVLMFGIGQDTQTKENVSQIQQVNFYSLSEEQVSSIEKDERISYQVKVKIGTITELEDFDVLPYYISEFSDQIKMGELEEGRLPQKADEVAVQAAQLKRLGVEQKVGSTFTLTFFDGSTETFTVSGILKGSDTAKQFSMVFSKEYADHGSQLADEPYEILAKVQGATSMSKEECKELMYQIGSDAGMERKNIDPVKAFLDSLSPDVQNIMVALLVGGVILLACVLVIYGVFYLSIIGKIRQFGQLRTIGMTKMQIKKLVSREGNLIFIRSIPLGLLIGGIAGYVIMPQGFRLLNTVIVFAIVFVVIYIVTRISILKPAKIAALVSPMEALRYVSQESMKQASNRKTCRTLTPAGMGVMNFSKNRKKAITTLFSLALGGVLFMTAATFMSSFDKVGYSRQTNFADAEFDISISPSAVELNDYGMSGIQNNNPLSEQFEQDILKLDGVERVTGLQEFGVKFDIPIHDEYGSDDVIYPLKAEDMGELDQYLEAGSMDYDKLMSGEYLLMGGNNTAEEIYGWRFEVGDKVILHYFDGSGMAEREVTVLGILNSEYQSVNRMNGWFLMPEAVIHEWVSYNSLNSSILVTVSPDKEEAIGLELEKMVAASPELSMDSLQERIISDEAYINKIFGAISGLSIFIMLFSILSMMNTLITNIVTRKQELAMLESVGMSKKQIYKMILGESFLLVAVTLGITLTLGTLCGFALCNILYNAGAFYIAFRFPLMFTLAYAGVLTVVPLIITLVSINSFSKMTLVERLKGTEC